MKRFAFTPAAVTTVLVLAGLLILQSDEAEHGAEKAHSPGQQTVTQDIQELTLTNIDTGMPSHSKATFNQKTKEFSWTPTCSDSGRYRVKFTATDGKRTHEEVITVRVREACEPNEP